MIYYRFQAINETDVVLLLHLHRSRHTSRLYPEFYSTSTILDFSDERSFLPLLRTISSAVVIGMVMDSPLPYSSRSVCVHKRDPIIYPCILKTLWVVLAVEDVHVCSMNHVVCQNIPVDIRRSADDGAYDTDVCRRSSHEL